jgi:hypothetical protein
MRPWDVSSWGRSGGSVLPHFFMYASAVPLVAPVSFEVSGPLRILA